MRTTGSYFKRFVTTGGALALAAVGFAGAAQAHEDGKPAASGSDCALSGMVDAHEDSTRYCHANASGELVWSKPLTGTKRVKVSVTDGWAKAADKGTMSAAFGVLSNTGQRPVRIVAATSPYAMAVQLHEMATSDGKMVMRETADGFRVPVGGSLELKPGGNHLMFMGLEKSIKAGSRIPVTLIDSKGNKVTIKVLARVFDGAQEDYDGHEHTGDSMGDGSMGDGSMGDGSMGDGSMGAGS